MKERFAKFMNKHGILVVLSICVLMAGAAVLAAALPGDTAAGEPSPTPELAAAGMQSDERLAARLSPSPEPAASAPAPTAAPTPMPDFTKAPEVTSAPVPAKATAPVSGSIQWGYAADCLIYSKTLDQWTTHPGVDVACAKGETVYAVWGGTVKDVYTDDLYGVSVAVEHENGLVSLYANLAADPPVEAGDRLNARDAIGSIGNTARCEIGDASHLHFELYKDGTTVNPEDYVVFEK